MKTIKELSESLGISKVSIYKMMKKEEIKKHTFKQDNISVIDEIGENIIRAYYNRERIAATDNILNESSGDKENKLNDDIMVILREQIKEKDSQINALLNIVANQQKVQAAQYIVDKQGAEITEKPVKRSFWDRFKR